MELIARYLEMDTRMDTLASGSYDTENPSYYNEQGDMIGYIHLNCIDEIQPFAYKNMTFERRRRSEPVYTLGSRHPVSFSRTGSDVIDITLQALDSEVYKALGFAHVQNEEVTIEIEHAIITGLITYINQGVSIFDAPTEISFLIACSKMNYK